MARPKERTFLNPKLESTPPTPDDWISQGAKETKLPKEEGPQKRITVTVSEELHKKAHIYARTQGTTVKELVTKFLEQL